MEPSACAQSCPSNHTSNAAGEHCHWEVSDNVRLRRFLCYGSEGDVYTASEEAHLGMAQAGALLSMLQEGRGIEAVNEIKRFAQDGRAVRLDPSIFALALCSQHAEKELKEDMKCGIWGRALRKAVSDWYNGQDALSLAAVVTRCKQREGWSHKDVLRLSHTKPADEALALISKYVAKGWKEVHVAYADKENTEEVVKVLLYLEVVEKVKHSCDETEVINLIEEHKLEREQLLTDHLKSKLVWRALLKEMPLQSVLWMLGKMTARKIVQPGASETQALCERMQTEAALKKAKLHPFSILLASEHYKRGQGYQGKTKWAADGSILKALDIAFYKSFSNIEPVGKSFVVAVDVSTSLSSVVPGTALSTAVAAAVITMVFARTEADTHVLAYSEGALELCSVSADMTLAQTTDELVKIPGGSTDCTLPIAWATDNGKAVDVFIILTNNPLWTFTASPVETLKKYRQTSGRHSKLVMCGLTSIGHTMPDTGDRGLLSICGFDLGAFRIIRNLAQNLI
ncbi:RNA-binding protein RO60 isoform X2 [Hippocampus comes]|uniref:RNA-binding protein RO60 isoform X2 n=1 Tax=Hippocampus comes TaxID=109280 RepID=UPI00094E7E1F|nr:PREDICTED: 60 kDa SS-A/Ro ribonucleoprotein isoform X2 [Hippocampus comes]